MSENCCIFEYMLREEVNGPGDLERALKRLKKKVLNVGVIKELRNRRYFVKPSVKKRQEKIDAEYRQKKRREDGE